MNSNTRVWTAEFVGTFALVFLGTGVVIVDQTSGGAVTHVGVSLVFGLVVMAMIYAVGDVSGAHLNPAVTFGFWAARRLDGSKISGYVASQCLGAIAASFVLRFLFPSATTLGETLPSGTVAQSFVLETLLTGILMFVILSVSTGSKEKGLMAGVAVGAVIALAALMGGPISGASMNPARSLGPALANSNWAHFWVYCIAPPLGAGLAVCCCRCVHEGECCGGKIECNSSP